MWKRVAVAMVVALACATVASAQAEAAGRRLRRHRARRPRSRPRQARRRRATRARRRRPSWGIRGCGSCRPARCCRPEVVGQRLPRELRLRPGLHGRQQLAGDVRRSVLAIARRSSARGRSSAASIATSARSSCRGSPRPAASSTTTRSSDRAGRTISSATSGWAPRSTCCRSTTQQPVALAVRGMVKLPTAKDDDEGVGTGKTDFAFDAIVSKEINQRVELSGYGGFDLPRRSGRRRPDERIPLGLRRGLADAQGICGSPRNCTANSTSTTRVTYTGVGADWRRRICSRRPLRRSTSPVNATSA